MFFIALSVIISGCAGDKEPKVEVAALDDEVSGEASQKIMDFFLEGYNDDGTKKWDVKGDSADMLPDNTVKILKVDANGYGKDNSINLTADTGVLNRDTNDVHLEKNVVAVTKDRGRLLTDWLDYHAEREEITTDAFVKLTKDNMVVTGTGAVTEPGMNKARLNKYVTAIMKKEGSNETTTITCDGILDVFYKKNMAVFNDNVKVADNKGFVYADRMEVHYNSDAREIKNIFATGNVSIIRDDNVTYSQKAKYVADEERLVLSGVRPRVVFYAEEADSAFTEY